MNEKNFGLWAVLVMLVSIMGVGYYSYNKLDDKQNVLDSFIPPDSRKHLGVDQKVLDEIEMFKSSILDLPAPSELSDEQMDNIFWGMLGDEVRQASIAYFSKTGDYTVFSDIYSLSMVYISNNRRYAVINGRVYRTNDELDEGGKLLSIVKNKVQIARKDFKGENRNAWVVVENKTFAEQQSAKGITTGALSQPTAFDRSGPGMQDVLNKLKRMQ